MLAFHRLQRISGIGTYFYLYSGSLLILIATCSSIAGGLRPELTDNMRPLMDISLALIGISMAGASAWLAYTFKQAGDRVD